MDYDPSSGFTFPSVNPVGWQEIKDTAVSVYQEANSMGDMLLSNPVTPHVLAVVLVFVCIYLMVVGVHAMRVKGKTKSKGKHRMPNVFQRMLIEDAVQDALDDAVLAKKISARQRKYWMQEIGSKAGLPGLTRPKIVRKLHPARIERVKGAIMSRLYEGAHAIQAKIPGPPPEPIKGGKKLSNKAKLQSLITT